MRVLFIVAAHFWLSYSLAWTTARDQVFAGRRNRAKERIERSEVLKVMPRLAKTVLYGLGCPECQSFWYGLALAPIACAFMGVPGGWFVPAMLALAVGAKGFTTFAYRRMVNPFGL